MKHFFAFVLFFSLALSAALIPTPPEQDGFYDAPDGFEKEEKGTILKWRDVPTKIRSVLFPVNIKNAWQALIRTEDALGAPIASVITIFEPYNGDNKKLVAYNVAEDAADPNCAPSYAFQNGGGIDTVINQVEMFLIQTALDQGYYVVSPDYEGPNAAFGAGVLAGQIVLDSIRAALKSGDKSNIDSEAKVAIWGYSGGSIATGWAAALQPTYAPELKPQLVGAAFGGWVTNLTGVADTIDGTLFAGFVFTAVNGLGNQYPEQVNPVIKDEVKPLLYLNFVKNKTFCEVSALVYYAFQRIFKGISLGRYSKQGWKTLDDPRIVPVLRNNTLGIEETKYATPEIPLFAYQGRIDEIVPYKDAIRVYNVWCDAGVESFEFNEASITGHGLEAVGGVGAALKWIKDRFDGVEPVKGCRHNVRITNLTYPGAILGYLDTLNALLDNVFGFKIGPDSTSFPDDRELFSRALGPQLRAVRASNSTDQILDGKQI